MDVARVKELRDSGMGASAIAKELGIGRASVYRALGSKKNGLQRYADPIESLG